MNQAIMITVEDCGKENFAKAVTRNGQKKKTYYLIKGWAYVRGRTTRAISSRSC